MKMQLTFNAFTENPKKILWQQSQKKNEHRITLSEHQQITDALDTTSTDRAIAES